MISRTDSGPWSGGMPQAWCKECGFYLSVVFEDVTQIRDGAYFHWGKHLLGNCVESRLERGKGRWQPVRNVIEGSRWVRMGRWLGRFGVIWSKAHGFGKCFQDGGKRSPWRGAVGHRGLVKSRKIPRFWLKELDTWECPPIRRGGWGKSKLQEVWGTEFKGSVWT